MTSIEVNRKSCKICCVSHANRCSTIWSCNFRRGRMKLPQAPCSSASGLSYSCRSSADSGLLAAGFRFANCRSYGHPLLPSDHTGRHGGDSPTQRAPMTGVVTLCRYSLNMPRHLLVLLPLGIPVLLHHKTPPAVLSEGGEVCRSTRKDLRS